MSPAERLGLGVALWSAGHDLQRAALRRRYPDADDDEIGYQMAVARFGQDLARAAWRTS